MMRVLVVEDEPLIAQSIARLTEEHHAFAVSAIVSNGLDALEHLRRDPVDAVITDIRMPGMDGLDLLRAVYDEFPDIFTVIISGYQVFSYAQTAITYQAFDYLLKPVTREAMNKVLSRLEIACTIKRREKKRSLLQSTVWTAQRAGEDRTGCTVLLFCAGALPYIGSSQLAPGQLLWDELDLEALLAELVPYEFTVFHGKHQGERVVVLETGGSPVDGGTIQGIYRAVLDRAGEICVTVVGHAQPVPMYQVGEIIQRLQHVLYNEILLYRPALIWRDCTKGNGQASRPVDLPVERVVGAIAQKDGKALSGALTGALESISDQGGTQQDVMRLLDLIVGDTRLSASLSTRDYTALKIELSEAVVNNTDTASLVRDLQTILLAGQGGDGEKRDTRAIMDEVERFLQENYDQQITHQTLSKQFGFVPSYLSRKFREYKQMSPYEYLLHLRMTKARHLLSEQPDILVREVARMVGYSDHNYFSKLFKKETGLWPSEYQKHTEEGEAHD